MNNNNNAKALVSHLEQEINWIEALNLILSEEKTTLASRQFDQLEELANKKQELSNKLEESAKQRLTIVNHSVTGEKEFLKNFSTEEAKQISRLNIKLAEKLTYCRELNTVNGQVIANNIHTRQEIVNALSGNKADAVNVYTSNGTITSKNDNNHHQEA